LLTNGDAQEGSTDLQTLHARRRNLQEPSKGYESLNEQALLGAVNSQTMLLVDTELEQDWKLATVLKNKKPLRAVCRKNSRIRKLQEPPKGKREPERVRERKRSSTAWGRKIANDASSARLELANRRAAHKE
jgi:hypothetical protein